MKTFSFWWCSGLIRRTTALLQFHSKSLCRRTESDTLCQVSHWSFRALKIDIWGSSSSWAGTATVRPSLTGRPAVNGRTLAFAGFPLQLQNPITFLTSGPPCCSPPDFSLQFDKWCQALKRSPTKLFNFYFIITQFGTERCFSRDIRKKYYPPASVSCHQHEVKLREEETS